MDFFFYSKDTLKIFQPKYWNIKEDTNMWSFLSFFLYCWILNNDLTVFQTIVRTLYLITGNLIPSLSPLLHRVFRKSQPTLFIGPRYDFSTMDGQGHVWRRVENNGFHHYGDSACRSALCLSARLESHGRSGAARGTASSSTPLLIQTDPLAPSSEWQQDHLSVPGS